MLLLIGGGVLVLVTVGAMWRARRRRVTPALVDERRAADNGRPLAAVRVVRKPRP
jgi:hypothetical protein